MTARAAVVAAVAAAVFAWSLTDAVTSERHRPTCEAQPPSDGDQFACWLAAQDWPTR